MYLLKPFEVLMQLLQMKTANNRLDKIMKLHFKACLILVSFHAYAV